MRESEYPSQPSRPELMMPNGVGAGSTKWSVHPRGNWVLEVELIRCCQTRN